MNYLKNLLEYYDELYPVSTEQKVFFKNILKKYKPLSKMLRIGCGTGLFEVYLSQQGYDVTGLEVSREMIQKANRKKREQMSNIRFFCMSSFEMQKYLCHHFYDVIYCLNNRINFTQNDEQIEQFFCDCKTLNNKNGSLIIEFIDGEKSKNGDVVSLPSVSSPRCILNRHIKKENDNLVINYELEKINGTKIPLIENEKYNLISVEKIKNFAKKAGYKNFDFYESYTDKLSTAQNQSILCALS